MASPEYFNAMAKGSHMLIRQGFLGKVYDAIHLGMRRQLQGTDDTALEESVQVRNLGILLFVFYFNGRCICCFNNI